MNPLSLKAAAIGAGIALAVGVGAGWTVQGWRLTGKINELQGVADTQAQSLALLEASNIRCSAGVEEVKASVQGYVAASEKRLALAAEAMRRAERAASGHLAAAKAALSRPAPKPGEECAAAAAEASAYARKRKAAP